MSRLKVHILYEHGQDLKPFGSAQIRLLRPLFHPSLHRHIKVTTGIDYEGQAVDVVIVDRMWRPNISVEIVNHLLDKILKNRAKLIYAIDDNLLDLPLERPDWADKDKVWVIETFLNHADQVWVTTHPLKERLSGFNKNITVLPNVLDEQLLLPSSFTQRINKKFRSVQQKILKQKKIIIGYMGTFTHDKDLKLITSALEHISEQYQGKIEVHLLGVIEDRNTLTNFSNIPIKVIPLPENRIPYPSFLSWFTNQFQWDIGLAPLEDTPFTQCKSDIKFLDYSALGAVGIYSDVPAYQDSVRHKKTGWLTKNQTDCWIEALNTLIDEPALRKQLAMNAVDYLHSERILAHRAIDWWQALQ